MAQPYKCDNRNRDYSAITGIRDGIRAHNSLIASIEQSILPGTGVSPSKFWALMNAVVARFTKRNYDLLKFRDSLQLHIDDWYRSGCQTDQESFLRKIGYLVPAPSCDELSVSSANVDPEIALVPSPQLVVPVDNDRFVVNAVNSRWGSLSAAVTSTDVLGVRNPSKQAVHEYLMSFLDQSVPLLTAGASWRDVEVIKADRLGGSRGASLRIVLKDGTISGLRNHMTWVGWALDSVFLKHHGLHIWIQTNADGKGIQDIVLESSLTAILDLEDSVAAVDAHDKSKAYINWAKVMAGDMSVRLGDSKESPVRSLRKDIYYRTPTGTVQSVSGRVLALVRNVGIHCKTNIVLDKDMNEVYEGLVDAVVTIVAGSTDLRSSHSNSRTGSIYIVKPKLHGPDEVQFACDLFGFIEAYLGIPTNTVKIGIMDEERRTSVNLRACIAVAQSRIFFINTGFLDRTGDEIHTCMRGGPVLPKAQIKKCEWITAYEKLNVINGVSAGFLGKAQIGKGMWAEPDSMKAMMDEKIAHPKSAASTAWVPSPTAATLHAIHYHQVNVKAVQRAINNSKSSVTILEKDLLKPPIMSKSVQTSLTREQICNELNNNAQGILGYVVRWVDLGIGCSKVPDIRNVGLMEDLATLRISSQHISNWLLHGIVSESEVREAFEAMAKTVDMQNSKDLKYRPMCKDLNTNIAFQTALVLVKNGTKLANGYSIEPLVEARRKVKAATMEKVMVSESVASRL